MPLSHLRGGRGPGCSAAAGPPPPPRGARRLPRSGPLRGGALGPASVDKSRLTPPCRSRSEPMRSCRGPEVSLGEWNGFLGTALRPRRQGKPQRCVKLHLGRRVTPSPMPGTPRAAGRSGGRAERPAPARPGHLWRRSLGTSGPPWGMGRGLAASRPQAPPQALAFGTRSSHPVPSRWSSGSRCC